MKEALSDALLLFLSTSYILIVVPSLLVEIGLDFERAFFSLVLSLAIGSFLSGLIVKKPLIIAPSVSLSVFFTYSFYKVHKINWETALAALLLVGILMLSLSISKWRIHILNAFSPSIKNAITASLGLFLILTGLEKVGLTFSHNRALISSEILIASATLLIISYLLSKNVKGAMLFGVLAVTGTLIFLSFLEGKDVKIFSIPKLEGEFLKFDLLSLFNMNALSLVLSLFIIILLDSTGMALALINKMEEKKKALTEVGKVMIAESLALISNAFIGALPSTVLPESGVIKSLRNKVDVAFILSVIFSLSLFFLPLIKSIPQQAIGIVIFLSGFYFLKNLRFIDLKDYSEALPALLIVSLIPFTKSIALGIGIGFIFYTVLKIILLRFSDIKPCILIISILFFLDFIDVF